MKNIHVKMKNKLKILHFFMITSFSLKFEYIVQYILILLHIRNTMQLIQSKAKTTILIYNNKV